MDAIRPRSNDFVICATLSLKAYPIAKANLIVSRDPGTAMTVSATTGTSDFTTKRVISSRNSIVSFSNRHFPMKAVAIWRALDTSSHTALVKLYLERAGFNDVRVELLADGR